MEERWQLVRGVQNCTLVESSDSHCPMVRQGVTVTMYLKRNVSIQPMLFAVYARRFVRLIMAIVSIPSITIITNPMM